MTLLVFYIIVLVVTHITLQHLITLVEQKQDGEEISPRLVTSLSNEDTIARTAAQLQLQQQQKTIEPSKETAADVVNQHSLQLLLEFEDNHTKPKEVINNSPPKFNPPPGYWKEPHQEFGTKDQRSQSLLHQQSLQQRLHKNYHPILPKKVITVVGPESSGSTFLTTTLAMAIGADLGISKKVSGRVMTADRKYEIQHLSLPWGWQCENNDGSGVSIVDALVPLECFRYELAPSLDPIIAEEVWMTKYEKQKRKHDIYKNFQVGHKKRKHEPPSFETPPIEVAKSGPQTATQVQELQQCRDEVLISEESELSCGAKCGVGDFHGYALYPRRFSINITKHIEWYLHRGVDVHVILSIRDRSISKRGKEKLHCEIEDVAEREDDVAIQLMTEGLEQYGPYGSKEKDRVIVSSYEALMTMKDDYLFGLYKQLQINSTYAPSFVDGNEKYVTDANAANLGKYTAASDNSPRLDDLARSPMLPGGHQKSKASFLPNKLITVVGLEGSGLSLLSTTLRAASTYDSTEVQHISLPQGRRTCEKSDSININTNVVDALVPEDCFRYETQHFVENDELNGIDPLIATKCQEQLHISSEMNNIKGQQWSCGGKCGNGGLSGFALYPERYYVNMTSHIQWYLSRGVDIKVVLLLRDRTISMNEKTRSHCHIPEVADAENDIAMEIMREAYKTYGSGAMHASAHPDNDGGGDARVMVVSYEGLMQLKQPYLFQIYNSLGLKSTYVPDFVDENRKYVALNLQHQKHGSSLHKKGHDGNK